MNEEKNCRNCEHSGEWGNLIVCWLYSDEEIVVLTADDEACEDYKEEESKC